MLLGYLPWLGGTLMLEIGAVAALAPGGVRRRAVAVCAAVNLCTHPLAFMLQRQGFADLLLLELLVTAVELLVYWRLLPLSALRCAVLAVVANLVSAGAMLVVWAIMHP